MTTENNEIPIQTEEQPVKKGLVWIPLGYGFSDKDKEELEQKFGSNWRDLFNVL